MGTNMYHLTLDNFPIAYYVKVLVNGEPIHRVTEIYLHPEEPEEDHVVVLDPTDRRRPYETPCHHVYGKVQLYVFAEALQETVDWLLEHKMPWMKPYMTKYP